MVMVGAGEVCIPSLNVAVMFTTPVPETTSELASSVMTTVGFVTSISSAKLVEPA